jgi:tRNA threonylcarbamoyladenosine biosynthesis protein TsaE
MQLAVTSPSADATQRLGEQLGALLQAGDIVCLYGELGSGKTVLARGLARGLGVGREATIRSPSFVLIHRYEGRVPVYHADLYRLEGPADVEDIGLRECLGGDGVAVIEWADKLAASLPAERLDVTLRHAGGDTRCIALHALGARYAQVLAQWQERCARAPEADSAELEATGGIPP